MKLLKKFSLTIHSSGWLTAMADLGRWSHNRNQDMVDISLAFKALVDDFVGSAETEEQFRLFPMMGLAAWNLSHHTEKQRAELIQVFIDRFNCPTFICDSTVMQTKEKILELCSRKLRMYPELKQRIISVDIEGMEDGLKYAVVSIDGPTSRCT